VTPEIDARLLDPNDRLGILIVDDDPDHLFLSRRLMERAGMEFSITTAAGGCLAVAHLTQACEGACPPPALVFLDINMPEMNGFDVLRWIRAKAELAQVRVIILSSSDDPRDAIQATELGANGYLIKDPNPAVVACILRQVWAERARLPYQRSLGHHAQVRERTDDLAS
jgi:CheY-like chemotaxis protein